MRKKQRVTCPAIFEHQSTLRRYLFDRSCRFTRRIDVQLIDAAEITDLSKWRETMSIFRSKKMAEMFVFFHRTLRLFIYQYCDDFSK